MHSSDHLHRDARWTTPNVLTALRILMAGTAAVLFAVQSVERTAVVLCVVAAALDAFDGWYARTFSQCSRLGKHLDPLADKLLMSVVYGLIAVKMGSPTVWVLVALIAVREAGMTAFRAYSLRRHDTFIPANGWGKSKMVLQSVFGIVLIAYAYFVNGGFDFPPLVVTAPLVAILIISYYSAIIYILCWRGTIQNVVGAVETGAPDENAGRRCVAGE